MRSTRITIEQLTCILKSPTIRSSPDAIASSPSRTENSSLNVVKGEDDGGLKMTINLIIFELLKGTSKNSKDRKELLTEWWWWWWWRWWWWWWWWWLLLIFLQSGIRCKGKFPLSPNCYVLTHVYLRAMNGRALTKKLNLTNFNVHALLKKIVSVEFIHKYAFSEFKLMFLFLFWLKRNKTTTIGVISRISGSCRRKAARRKTSHKHSPTADLQTLDTMRGSQSCWWRGIRGTVFFFFRPQTLISLMRRPLLLSKQWLVRLISERNSPHSRTFSCHNSWGGEDPGGVVKPFMGCVGNEGVEITWVAGPFLSPVTVTITCHGTKKGGRKVHKGNN